MAFNTNERKLINRELRRKAPLVTKKFIGIRKKKTGRFVEVFKNRNTGKIEELPVAIELLRFKLKVARSR